MAFPYTEVLQIIYVPTYDDCLNLCETYQGVWPCFGIHFENSTSGPEQLGGSMCWLLWNTTVGPTANQQADSAMINLNQTWDPVRSLKLADLLIRLPVIPRCPIIHLLGIVISYFVAGTFIQVIYTRFVAFVPVIYKRFMPGISTTALKNALNGIQMLRMSPAKGRAWMWEFMDRAKS